MKKTYSKSIIYFGEKCELEITVRNKPSRPPSKHTTIYVDLPWYPEEVGLVDRRPPYTIRGKDPAIDREWQRYNKKEIELQFHALVLASKLLQTEGITIPLSRTGHKNLYWSRTAGCSCGCSPGWIYRNYLPKNVWVKIISPKKQAQIAMENADRLSKREAETMESVVI